MWLWGASLGPETVLSSRGDGRYRSCGAKLSCSVSEDSATPWTVARQAPLSTRSLQARTLEWVSCPPPGDLPDPGAEPRSSSLQVDSLPSEPSGKPRNPGVGRLSLLQDIIQTQESNRVSCIAGGFLTGSATRNAPTTGPAGAQLLAHPSQTQDSPSLNPRLPRLQGCGSSPGHWALRAKFLLFITVMFTFYWSIAAFQCGVGCTVRQLEEVYRDEYLVFRRCFASLVYAEGLMRFPCAIL